MIVQNHDVFRFYNSSTLADSILEGPATFLTHRIEYYHTILVDHTVYPLDHLVQPAAMAADKHRVRSRITTRVAIHKISDNSIYPGHTESPAILIQKAFRFRSPLKRHNVEFRKLQFCLYRD